MKRFRQRKAFTIVEMVIVIAVIAILATVLVPTFGGIIQKANHSADTQFAASLNIQLAMWQVDNGQIQNESDLRKAINYYYGDWEDEAKTQLKADGDFYAKLSPKSAPQGYHYWWNAEENRVELETYEKLAGLVAPADVTVPHFSAASPRSLVINGKNYFLMDQAGSELADVFTGEKGLEILIDPQDYEDTIKNLEEMDDPIAQAILGKLSLTTIVNNKSAFRFYANDAEDIEYIWISPKAAVLQQTVVYVYKDGMVDQGQNSTDLAKNVTKIDLPDGVTIGIDGLKAPVVDTYTNETTRDYANSTSLYVNTTKVEDLEKLYTNCVLVMSNGARYVWMGQQLYALPVQVNANGIPTDTPAGTVDADTMKIDGFEIECDEVASNINTGPVFFYTGENETVGKLYVAYDKGSVALSLTSGLTNNMVTWTSSNDTVASVSNGVVTINSVPDSPYTVTIKATYLYDDTKTAEMTIYIVQPKTVALDHGFSIPNTSNAITLTYTGDETKTFNLVPATLNVGLNQNGIVTMTEECELIFSSTDNNLFTVSTAGVLTINPDNLKDKTEAQLKQTVTITYKGKTTGAEYIKYSYVVSVKDESECPIKVNNITSAVAMGQEYLFRVGNENSFALGKLFNGTTDKTVTVNIYDADLTNGGVYQAIGSTGKTFTASYTAGATWDAGTIKFEGTGVAIIKLTVGNKSVELAVEVVSGKNVTSYNGDTGLKSSGTNVLLNNITMSSGGQFKLTNGTLYGNGFTFDVSTGGTTGNGDDNNYLVALSNSVLDNVQVIGKVYTEYGTGSKDDHTRATVLMSGISSIYNSYISNSMSAVRVLSGTATIENTTLKGGVFANLDIRGGNIALENVTTINQANANDKAGENTVVGLGIAVWYEGDLTNTKLSINGLTQWNYISAEQTGNIKSSTNAFAGNIGKDVVEALLKKSGAYKEIGEANKVKWVNTGILSANSSFKTSNIEGLPAGYAEYTASLGLGSGTCWTDPNAVTEDNVTKTLTAYAPDEQKPIEPSFTYTGLGTTKGDNAQSYQYRDGSYTYENGKVKYYDTIHLGSTSGTVTMNNVMTGVNLSKYTGQNFVINVETSGTKDAADPNKVTFTEGEGYITYKVTDTLFFDKTGGKVKDASAVYEFTVKVVVEKTSLPKAIISYNGSGTIYWNSTGFLDKDYYICVPILNGLTITTDTGETIFAGGGKSVPSGLTYSITTVQSAGAADKRAFTKLTQKTKNSTLYIQSDGAIDNYHGGGSGEKYNGTQTIVEVTYYFSRDGYQTADPLTVRFVSESGKNTSLANLG